MDSTPVAVKPVVFSCILLTRYEDRCVTLHSIGENLAGLCEGIQRLTKTRASARYVQYNCSVSGAEDNYVIVYYTN